MTRHARPARAPRSGAPRKAYHHGDLPRALVAEAVRTIQKSGVAALTLRAVGDRLGVSRTALYRHFADKNALLAAVADEGFRTLRQNLVDAWEGGGHGRTGFDAMGRAYVRFAILHPSHYRVMFGATPGPAAPAGEADPRTDAFGVLVDAIREQQRVGLLRGDDPHVFASYIWSVVHGLAMLALDDIVKRDDMLERLVPFALERLHSGIDAGTRE